MQRRLQRAGIVVIAVAATLALASCGGSGSSTPSPARLLSQTFGVDAGKIHSGDLSLTIDADLTGLKALGGKPLTFVASGPFTEGPAFTEFDLSATVTLNGQTVPLSVVSTGKAFYIGFAGTFYALPSSLVGSELKSVHAETGASGSTGLLAKLGIQPVQWLTSPKIVGSATVGGVATKHLTAQIDVAKLVSDVAKVASGVGGKQDSSAVSAADLSEIVSAVNSASINVYTGASDHILREAALAISFTVPAAAQKALDGVTGGSFSLNAEITNLNAPETITAPKSSEPLSDLLGGSGGAFLGL